ncbi:MAG: chemotaxis protein CheX [Fibrobacterota bacterium]
MLKDQISQVFEVMAFSEVIAAEEYPRHLFSHNMTPFYYSTIQLYSENETAEYSVRLMLSHTLAPRLVTALIPEKKSISEQDCRDMTGEILNTILGNFLLETEDEIQGFSLTPPETGWKNQPMDAGKPIMTLAYIIDDRYPVSMQFFNRTNHSA